MAIIFTVFGVTGSSSLYLVRPTLHNLFGMQGSMKEGPWSYRLTYLAICMPAYSIMLVSIGTLAGRHAYFKKIAMRMWGRFLPSKYRSNSSPNNATNKKRLSNADDTLSKRNDDRV
jgi:hypothetical protein